MQLHKEEENVDPYNKKWFKQLHEDELEQDELPKYNDVEFVDNSELTYRKNPEKKKNTEIWYKLKIRNVKDVKRRKYKL